MTRSIKPVAVLVLAASLSGFACDKPSSPRVTGPSPSLSGSAELPPITLRATVDGRADAVAIANASEVAFEFSGVSGGDKLRYDLQFGDGQSAATPTATHIYTNAGTFTATLTVIDGADRHASASQSMTVRSLQGTWFHAGFNARSGRFEIHRIAISAQQGSEIRGRYTMEGSADRVFTGRLTKERAVEITTEDGVRFEGFIPDAFAAENAVVTLAVHGGSADGQTLSFAQVIGEPASPGPKAVLRIKSAGRETAYAIMGLPVSFDASDSTGDSLTYFVEFGDGSVSDRPVAAHAVTSLGSFRARVTVVDRYGRVASTLRSFDVRPLPTYCGHLTYFYNSVVNAGSSEFRRILFDRHEGERLEGVYVHPGGWVNRFTGRLGGKDDIEITLDDGTIEFRGTVSFDPLQQLPPKYPGFPGFPGEFGVPAAAVNTIRLTPRGGSASGMNLEFARGHDGDACY